MPEKAASPTSPAASRGARRKRDFDAVTKHAPKGGPEGAAFFDFDKTLLHGDAAIVFGRHMAKWVLRQGDAMKPAARAVFYAYVARRLGGLLGREAAYRTLYTLRIVKRSKLHELAYQAMEGLPTHHLTENMERVWQDVLAKRLYPQMVDVMDRHRKLGQRVVIVSTGLREIVEHAKRYVGEADVIAVDAGHENGLWTGKVKGPLYGGHKAALIREYAATHGVDLARSYAYSDHYSDHEFLAAVGHPVAVNPKLRLRRLAEKRGWTVLDLPPPA